MKGLALRYGADEPWIFRDLSLDVMAGTSFAITGPSGSGKTSLMKIMMGLLPASEGRVLIDGQEIRTPRGGQLSPPDRGRDAE